MHIHVVSGHLIAIKYVYDYTIKIYERGDKMIITREVDGKRLQFALTFREMTDAHSEVQHQIDVSDMEDYIDPFFEDQEWFKESYGVNFTLADSIESIDEMATILRTCLDRYEMSWEYAREEALREWCNQKNSNNNKGKENKNGEI